MFYKILLLILIGIAQGILEWIPVSSEAFLFILFLVYGASPTEAFLLSIIMHFPTALSAIIYYKEDYKRILKSFLNSTSLNESKKILRFLIIGTIFTGLTAFPVFYTYKAFLQNIEENIYLGSMIALAGIGFAMMVMGIFLGKATKTYSFREAHNITFSDSMLLGIAQGFSVLPGISRSGLTISVLLFRKFKQDEAVRLSFLIAPIIIIAGVIFEILLEKPYLGIMKVSIIELVILSITAFFSALISIKFMIKLARRLNFSQFLIVMGLFLAVYGIGAFLAILPKPSR